MTEILTAREAAAFLKMNERTVIKLAHEGKIPAARIGRRWRFEKNHILEWLEGRMRSMPNHQLATLEEHGIAPTEPLFGVLKPEMVNLELSGRSRRAVLEELVALLASNGAVGDRQRLLQAALEREELASTAVGDGVAFPHPRTASSQFVRKPAVAFGRSTRGINFDAEDGQPVRLFFFVCAPEEKLHLRLLARLNRLLRNPALRRALLEAETPEEALRCIRREEERLGLAAQG